MAYTNLLFVDLNPVTSHYPLSRQDAAHVSDWVNYKGAHGGALFVTVGNMPTGTTLDAKLQQAQDASGTGAKDITGKVITQLTAAGGDSNSLVAIEFQTEELDVNNGFEYVRFVVTIDGGDVVYGATLFSRNARYKPVSTTAFDELVA